MHFKYSGAIVRFINNRWSDYANDKQHRCSKNLTRDTAKTGAGMKTFHQRLIEENRRAFVDRTGEIQLAARVILEAEPLIAEIELAISGELDKSHPLISNLLGYPILFISLNTTAQLNDWLFDAMLSLGFIEVYRDCSYYGSDDFVALKKNDVTIATSTTHGYKQTKIRFKTCPTFAVTNHSTDSTEVQS
ncbi:hypothetical protein [Undibacterium sp. CY21W]|uniref:hypothetical protein n=1 Tax=Undibacterium sp. CY21W TaxID=2762293 RepID=UPI00164C5AFD|nr:hypothetical protein [Undibacterium sp. CY21W]MBC3927798.1 hypothetical protein [Undibacterium sp. CY21W]